MVAHARTQNYRPKHGQLSYKVSYRMASVSRFEPRNCWRIQYTLRLRARSARKSECPSNRADLQLLARQIENLEDAAKTGIARMDDIEGGVPPLWWTDMGFRIRPRAVTSFHN